MSTLYPGQHATANYVTNCSARVQHGLCGHRSSKQRLQCTNWQQLLWCGLRVLMVLRALMALNSMTVPRQNIGTEPFRPRANSLPGANRPIGPWPIRSMALSLPGYFHSLELSLPGAKWPALSRPGTKVLANFRSLELSFPGTLAPIMFVSPFIYVCWR